MDDIRVLVIEDDTTARVQLARAIEKEGFKVQAAEDGRIGLELVKTFKPDIIFTDLKMPEIDGLEVVHTVTNMCPEIQVIIMTAFGETDNVISAIRGGVLDYIKKPIDLDRLILSLGRAREKIITKRNVPVFPTLLLAEDEAQIRERLARILEKENWNVVQAGNGKEAIELFKQQKIDIALLDIKMPEIDGLTALHEMRQLSHDFNAIVITGYGDESSAIQAMRDGAINFIKKPIDLDQMIVAVEKAVEQLTIERSLKYRIRELEIAQQIITKITMQNQIVLDLAHQNSLKNNSFIYKIINSLPVGLVVIDKTMKIRFVNEILSKKLGSRPQKIGEAFIFDLQKAGFSDLDWDKFQEQLNFNFENDAGALSMIQLSNTICITFIGFYMVENGTKEQAILVAFQEGISEIKHG